MSSHERKRVGDMKHGLTSARPRMSVLQRHGVIYDVRGTEYGCDKYARGNYHGPAPEGVAPVDRFLGYLDAALRHITAITQAINVAKGTGGDEVAACAVTDDVSGPAYPPSMLPHIAHAIASLMIGVECGVQDGLLPEDPGQPWRALLPSATALATPELAQKDRPSSERERIAALVKARVDGGAYDIVPYDLEPM